MEILGKILLCISASFSLKVDRLKQRLSSEMQLYAWFNRWMAFSSPVPASPSKIKKKDFVLSREQLELLHFSVSYPFNFTFCHVATHELQQTAFGISFLDKTKWCKIVKQLENETNMSQLSFFFSQIKILKVFKSVLLL